LAASDIRFEIQQYALLGIIPKVVFLKGTWSQSYDF
jgi:hypothetical protein